MNPIYLNIPLIKNEQKHQFEMNVGEHKARIVYSEEPGVITLIHTIVEPALQGQGAATAIIEKTLDYLEKNNLKLIAVCKMVVAYLQKHTEWQRILAQELPS